MLIEYDFNDVYDREIRVVGKYLYEVYDCFIDAERYKNDESYRQLIYNNHYNDALESCAFALVEENIDNEQ